MNKREFDYRQDVISIQEVAQSNKMYEAFLEAAPQFILQLSILLQTGDIGKKPAAFYSNFCAKNTTKLFPKRVVNIAVTGKIGANIWGKESIF